MNGQFIEEILELKTDLLNFLSNELLSDELKKAHAIFTMDEVVDQTHLDRGFNDWIIHDYQFEEQHSLIELFKANHEVDEHLSNAFAASKISYFSVMTVNGKQILKDIFDHTDYQIGNDTALDETAVIFTRVYPHMGIYYFVDEMIAFDNSYRESLIKGIMEKFNETRELLGYLDVTEFIARNRFLLYIYTNIIDELYLLQNQDEGLDMYSSVYAVMDREGFLKKLKENFHIKPLAPEHGVYQLFDDEGLVGEIVDLKDKVEFEYISQEALQAGKSLIEQIFESSLVHLEDAMVSLEDLL
jgi:hypothetical protein